MSELIHMISTTVLTRSDILNGEITTGREDDHWLAAQYGEVLLY